MVRNVVLVKLAPGQDPDAVAKAQQAFLDLNCPGTLSYVIGDDLELRDGNWSFAIVADFADTDAYRAYDQDEEHNRARAGLLPMTEQIARVQFEMPLSSRPRAGTPEADGQVEAADRAVADPDDPGLAALAVDGDLTVRDLPRSKISARSSAVRRDRIGAYRRLVADARSGRSTLP